MVRRDSVIYNSNIIQLLPSLFLLASLLVPLTVSNPPLQIQPVASSTVDVWIYDLGMCESSGNWKALNPVDLDGTPSKGKFQFKDGTFNAFSNKYGIATTSIWNGDEQELIVREMIKDKSVDLTKQFPDCVRKLGLPPSN